MRILALGVDHRSAPTAVREALAFEGGRLRRGLDALKAETPGAEFVLLTTCNRVKLYSAAETDPPDANALAIRETKEPDDWRTFNTKSMLGGVLLGQKKYADAEPLLLDGYEGMKKREANIPAQGTDYLRSGRPG